MKTTLKAFVTGASGFIGSEVVRQLNQRGIHVKVLLRKSSSRENLKGAKYEEILGDLSTYDQMVQAVQDVDYVFHIAGVISAKSRNEYFKHNSLGTGLLAKAVAEINPGLKRFVYVSSLAASGPAQELRAKTENDPEFPLSAYGESKLGGERELARWGKDFNYTIVRPPAVYGPKDKGIFEFIKIVNKGIIPILPTYNDQKEKYFSLIHVEDLVLGIIESGIKESQTRQKHETFFLCNDPLYSWSKVMGTVAQSLGKKTIRIKVPNFILLTLAATYSGIGVVLKKSFPLTLDKLKELKPDYWICSNEKARNVIQFCPKYDLEAGMKNTVGWYRENHWLT